MKRVNLNVSKLFRTVAIVLALVITSCGGGGNNQSKKTAQQEEAKDVSEVYSKTISFKGGSCELYELQKQSMFAPAGIKQGQKAFMLRLKCSLDDETDAETLQVLYGKGEFVATDGNRYKAGASAIIRNEAGIIYSLIVAVPESIDVETLKFQFEKQTMLMSNK